MEARRSMAIGTERARLGFAFGTLDVDALFAPADLRRLEAVATIADAAPLRDFDDPRAREILGNIDILISGWGCPPIDAQVLAIAPKLRLIAHAAGSIKALAGPPVFARGIVVVSAADANALPVAEYTVAAMLFANKRVFDFANAYRRERRQLDLYLAAGPNVGNWRKTIGIIGASRVGRRVIELLRPFDFDVLLHDPCVSAEAARQLGAEKLELDAVLARSDLVSVHAPSLPETRHMLDARRLGLMRDGAVLINTARGALVEQAALLAELQSGRLSAVLDVTEPETLPPDSPLYDLPNVLLTPHIAGAVGDERRRFGQLIAGEVERFIAGEPLRHAIDPATLDYQA
jgi:phosphoglycerate dehydrogenase-like enzyme